jgi:transposase InsO family protein
MRKRYPRESVSLLCQLFGKSRNAYYDKSKFISKQIKNEIVVLDLVKMFRSEMPRIGTRKVYHLLQPILIEQQIKMGRDALHNLLLDHRMVVRKKKKYVRTTNSNHWLRKYPNLITDFTANEAEQLWVSDITYLRLINKFSYLSLITDAYSRKIVGYYLSQKLDHTGCLKALRMALSARCNENSCLIHHSDRGVQYCSENYVSTLKSSNILISMTESGSPYENAQAERINGILKSEFGLDQIFTSHANATKQVYNSINVYNEKRPHSSCDYLTPSEAHYNVGELNKRWKSYPYKKNQIEII